MKPTFKAVLGLVFAGLMASVSALPLPLGIYDEAQFLWRDPSGRFFQRKEMTPYIHEGQHIVPKIVPMRGLEHHVEPSDGSIWTLHEVDAAGKWDDKNPKHRHSRHNIYTGED